MGHSLWEPMGIDEREAERAGKASFECGVRNAEGESGRGGEGETGRQGDEKSPPLPLAPSPTPASETARCSPTPQPASRPRRPCKLPRTFKSCRDLGRQRAERLPPPSPRNVEAYRRVHEEGWTQDDVAADLGISQPRVSKILHNVKDYIAATGGLPRHSPAEQLRYCLARQLAEWEAFEQEVKEHQAESRRPYIWQTKIDADGKRGEQLERCEPRRVGYDNLRKGAMGSRQKVELALVEAQFAEPGDEARPEPPAPNPQSSTSTPPFGALYSPLPTAEAYDELTEKRWDVIDRGKTNYGKRCADGRVVSLPHRAAYWRYQALSLTQGIGGEERHKLVQRLLLLDELAVRAAAMEEAGAGECGVRSAEWGRKGTGRGRRRGRARETLPPIRNPQSAIRNRNTWKCC